MRVLIISAHPDDEVIGAGGTIARHVDEGDEVYWCVVTEAYSPPWPQEMLVKAQQQIDQVQSFLGIHEVFRLGFPTVKLNTIPYIELSAALQRVVDEARPEVVYTTPYSDINQDHRVVHDCTLVATRPLPGSSVRRVLCYEISPTTRFGVPSGTVGFSPNVFVDITEYLDKKLTAMAYYKTELRDLPHPTVY